MLKYQQRGKIASQPYFAAGEAVSQEENMKAKISFYLAAITALFLLSACSPQKNKIEILNAKMAKGVNEKLLPVEPAINFPFETTKIYCWFQWNNAEINTPIVASWQFVTDNIHILDYTLEIPRKEGFGSVSLTMPEGKNLPPGHYRVDLKKDKKLLKSLNFKVLEKEGA